MGAGCSAPPRFGVSHMDGFVKAMLPVIAGILVYNWIVAPLLARSGG